MALKRSEKNLVGVMMLAGGIALIAGVGLPNFDTLMANVQKKQQLEADLATNRTTQESLSATVQELERRTQQPSGINIRQYTPQDKERQIKELLDIVARTASRTGNKFIRLEPVEVDPIITAAAPPPAGTDPAAAGTQTAPPPADGAPATTPLVNSGPAAADPNAAAAQPALPPAQLDTFGYEFVIRGTYGSVQSFLRAMDQHKELIELYGIVLENETVGGEGADPSQDIDYSRPIRLASKLRLVMQPVSP